MDHPFLSAPFLACAGLLILARAFMKTVGDYYPEESGRAPSVPVIVGYLAALLVVVVSGCCMLHLMLLHLFFRSDEIGRAFGWW